MEKWCLVYRWNTTRKDGLIWTLWIINEDNESYIVDNDNYYFMKYTYIYDRVIEVWEYYSSIEIDKNRSIE